MGRPMLKICAKKGCDVTDCTSDPAQQEGVDFSVQVCFFRGLDSSSESQVPISNAVLTADLIFLQVSCRPSRRVDLIFCSAAAVGVLSRAQRCGFAAGFAGHAISK